MMRRNIDGVYNSALAYYLKSNDAGGTGMAFATKIIGFGYLDDYCHLAQMSKLKAKETKANEGDS